MLTDHWSAEHWTTRDQVEKLVELYELWDKPKELARWQDELARIENAKAKYDPSSPVAPPRK